MADSLKETLIDAAQENQCARFNLNAALQRAMIENGFVPNSHEFDIEHTGTVYRCQRGECVTNGEARVYYAIVGDWENIKHFVIHVGRS